MIEDAELLRRYAEEGSEAAFAELVQRHVGFVYACALRRVGGDKHLAENTRLRQRQISVNELDTLRADHAALPRLQAELDALSRRAPGLVP